VFGTGIYYINRLIARGPNGKVEPLGVAAAVWQLSPQPLANQKTFIETDA
jgi:hypothetical protein